MPGNSPAMDPGGVRRHRRLEKRRRHLRRARLGALVCAVVGAALVVTGWRLDGTQAVASETPSGNELATPMVSVRRIPELLLRPVADLRMAQSLAPLAEQSPPDSCISIGQAGSTAYGLRADTPLIPASNLKLVVGATALEVLGPETKLTTRVVANADPVQGIVQGDLYFVGGGDPIIETGNYDAALKFAPQPHTPLETLADSIRAAGVTRVTGNIVGDDGRYDSVRTVDSWADDDLTGGQVGPLSALSVNDARDRTDDSDLAPIVGGNSVPAENPAAHAADVLRELLIARGVTVDGAATAGQAPDEARQIASIDSAPVVDLVTQMLRFSDNNTAELLLKEVGRESSGEGSTEAGLAAERALLEQWGISTEGVTLVDGSGLSRENRATCNFLRALLDHEGPAGRLAGALAVPQENGTLRDRFAGSPAAGSVRAKTGTLSIVTGMSGWVRTPAEFDLSFSYLVNRPNDRIVDDDLTRQQQLTETLLAYPQTPDRSEIAVEEPRPVGSAG
ncbi:MAG: D-alanyl-D-alanine carboxypeptidase/D-alanyl-D-alanine-endopeptidase [Microthrixaceae bacterium]